jgi:formylglycine-generating enzyme required for sulfatase activity
MRNKLYSLFIGLVFIAGLRQSAAQVTNLGIAQVARGQFLLYWPVSATNYGLQTVTNPASTNWVAATNAVAVNAALVTNTAPAGYFRLLATMNPTAGMALVPAGSFTMGNYLFCNSATNDPDITNAIATNVYVSAFYMDVNLVSSNQWAAVYNYAVSNGYTFAHPGFAKAGNVPISQLSWFDCAAWCNARSAQAGLTPCYYTDGGSTQVFTNAANWVYLYQDMTKSGYRLPTEAEWEKAARGGVIGNRFPWGNVITESQANYNANPATYYYDFSTYSGYNTNFSSSGGSASPTGSFAPNGYGLYDMAGNFSEWCWDWYPVPPIPYQAGSPYLGGADPTGPSSGSGRVMRGGNWFDPASSARCAFRATAGDTSPQAGFRCVVRVN